MATAYLSRTAGTPTNSKKNTLSVWVKRSAISTGTFFGGGSDANNMTFINFDTNERIFIQSSTSGSNTLVLTTNRKFRDPSAWMHVVVTTDTTLGTAGDRIKLYVNGVRETSFSTETQPSQNYDMEWNKNGQTIEIGKYLFQSGYSQFDGSMTHFHFTDGYAYDASTFGESDSTSGIWKPKTSPSVTYGTNGFFLKMENSGAMGTDSSGQSNTFTVNGTLTQNVDTPSNNFATLNGIHVGGGASTLSNGNTTYSLSNYSYNTRSTLGMPSGKFYWEQNQSGTNTRIGLITSGFTIDLDTDNANAYYGGSGGGGVYLLMSNTTTSWQYTNNDTSQNTGTYTTAIASGANDILMGAVDVDAGKLWIGVNGVWFNSGNPATGSNATLTFTNSSSDELQIFAGYGTSSARVSSFNFGNGFFGTTAVTSSNADAAGHGLMEYAVPTGYYTLCTKNLNTYG